MGQKVNPVGFRVGVIRTWESRWFAKGRKFFDNLHEDLKLRDYLKSKLKHAGVARIEIERAAEKLKIIIQTARPGIVIGKKGTGIDSLKSEVQALTKSEVFLNIQEVRKPDIDAQLVGENIALQLEKRVSWRRAMKKALAAAIKGGVKGIKIRVSGRLDGAEIARSEWYNQKSVPLHTLRADIDYGTAEALTTYGIIGVKVWIYKGDILSTREVEEAGRVKS
ncbi:MAG: 30S ribosomal protein S3 [Bdellovibrionaceae bacterium]|nr:30S ribosomal protein S3 [Pseudobdellovibrionaceae bacterium]NUM60232.1 30S ribosomal protein S3 [Pseudobdellovibrionaceae bacterium]